MDKVKIHQTAEVAPGAVIGENTSIWQHCIIQRDVIIGKNCVVGANVFMENGVRLGDNVKVKNNIALYTGVNCEDEVFLGPNCVFTNVINPRSFIERKSEFRETHVRRGATIGANATVICGHNIGKYAMVGAGAVITKDIPDYALVVGNPANIIGYVCKCGERLTEGNDVWECSKCGLRYEKREEKMVALVEEQK